MLKFNNVSTSINKITVLRNVTVDIPKGAIVGVVGRNGAGKTTLLRAIMGSLPLDSGTMSLDGTNLQKIPPHKRVTMGIGYAPQERVIFPSMTIEENLRFPCKLSGYSKLEIDKSLEQTLDIVPQLKAMLQRSGAALSGGQGKMAALGRALMAGSRMVLLDEPFQGLAPALAVQYSDSLERLHAKLPHLCIVVTESNISLLGDIPNQVLYIERGAVTSSTRKPILDNDLSSSIQIQ